MLTYDKVKDHHEPSVDAQLYRAEEFIDILEKHIPPLLRVAREYLQILKAIEYHTALNAEQVSLRTALTEAIEELTHG